MDLETLWYELYPYFYGIGGLVAVVLPQGNWLLKLSGILLIGAAAVILRLRWEHRQAMVRRLPTAAEIASRDVHEG